MLQMCPANTCNLIGWQNWLRALRSSNQNNSNSSDLCTQNTNTASHRRLWTLGETKCLDKTTFIQTLGTCYEVETNHPALSQLNTPQLVGLKYSVQARRLYAKQAWEENSVISFDFRIITEFPRNNKALSRWHQSEKTYRFWLKTWYQNEIILPE